MKKNGSGKRGLLDPPPPEKFGWIRRFCGRGIFREIWKNRFVVLRADQLFICEKEVKELGRADEVLDLSDYDRCEEIRKNKTRSKKNHSKFRVQRCSSPGNTVPNLVFLAVSPEEKESWIQVLNAAITRAKNQILDEKTLTCSPDSRSSKVPQTRRLPTRGHLLAVASSSDGALTLDLIQEPPDGGPAAGADRPEAAGHGDDADGGPGRGGGPGGAEAERILMEATETWSQARDVLQEVKELQDLYRQL
ncbi:hypothetical protein KUCAC02_034861 [Chaenocephalus aceratus]|nr:hypothetical protein KUCAC02_034861 [Chaenocephalus aceratus]